MRRNNGWLAVLAVSLLLSIIRNSLAGERYPLDYGNAELPVNHSKTTYRTYNSNEPSLDSQNYLNPSSVAISSKSSTSTTTPLQSHLHINKKNTILSKSETKAITRRATKLSNINLPGENFNNDRSIHDDRRQSKLVDPNERSRNVRASESSEQVAEGSNSLSLEIPEQPRLSSWISRGAIKNISRRINRVRLPEPSKTREHKTTTEAIRRGSVLLDKGYPYYGHVRAISHDDDSLTTSEGQITGVKKRERSTRDSHQRKRSEKANALQTIPNISLGETNSFNDAKRQDHRQKVIKKRFLTGYSVFSVSLNRRLNGNLKATKLITARRSKGRRENGKKRFGRSVRYLKKKPSRNINLGPWYAPRDFKLSNSDPRNDIFKTGRGNHHSSRAEGFRHHSASHKSMAARRHAENTREFNGISPKQRSTIGHDDLGDKGTYSSSIREKRNFVLAGDTSDSLPKDETLENVTFHGTIKSFLEDEIDNQEGNIVEELKYDLVQDNFTENLIDQRQHKLEELNGNDTKVYSVTLELRNESHSKRHNFSTDSINRTKLEESSASSGNYSNLVTNILTSSNESSLKGDDINPVSVNRTKLEESNVENYSHLDLINQATLEDANISKSNYLRLMTSIFKLTNKSDSINHDTNPDSINRTLVKSYIPNRNYSKTNTLKSSNGSSSTIQDTSENSIDKIELKKSLNNQKLSSTAPSTINSRLNTDSRNSNNESVLMSPNTNNDLIGGMELDASWAEIDESQEGAIQTGEEERSTLSSVTKESENVFVNSPRGSVTAQRNSTHLRHDMNSLAEGSFVSKSNGLFQVTGRNANDPFSNSSTMQHGRKMVENFNVNTLPDQLLVNNEKQTESKLSLIPFQLQNVSKTVTFKEEEKASSRSNDKVVSKSSKINDKAVSVSDSQESRSIGHDEGKSNQRRLNGSLIVLRKDKSVDSRPIELLDQNTPTNTDEIKANEPTIRSSLKNDRGADELADDTTKDVNPVERGKKTVDNPEDRVSEDSTTLSTILINDRFSKERKSRSSKIGTSMKLRRDFTMETEGTVIGETSTLILNKDGVGQNNVLTLNIDPTLPEAGNDTTAASQVTLNDSLEFVPRNSSIVLTLMDQTTKDYFLTTNNVMLSSTEIDQMQMDIETSTISLSNDEDQLLSFDTIVTSLEPNDEDSRVTMEDVPLRNMDNSSHKLQSEEPPWPVKHSAVVEGDLVLGGLMMVHEREDYYTCGPVMPQGGVQALEAMLYTLDTLNDREIVPGVKIGAHILDDCDKDTYGLEMAVDFIKGSISNIDGAEYNCNKTAVRKVISGVVGAASSVTSIQVANLLRLFRIPQVSFFSTSPELSNKQRFEYFSRTIPSDHYQVKAMVDIVRNIGWRYVSIIYEESNYGIKAFEELEELLGKYNICIAIKEKLVKDSGVAEEKAYDEIVLKLLTKPRARGCIIFGSDQEVAGVMRAVRRLNVTGAFSWIGSDGWSARGLVSNGNEPEVEGTLSVQPQANPVKGFEEYFLNLTVENNRRNPWFVEFWEDHFQCKYPNSSVTPYNTKYTKPCTTKERLTKQNTAFEDQLQFVSDAVMAFAYAFRDMHKDLCGGKPGLCDAMKPTNGTELLRYLQKVSFEGLSGDMFKFDKNGDGPARYNIIHFKQVEPGKYKWVRVGNYLEGTLDLDMPEIQFKLGHPLPPESVCSLPCEVGQAKKYVEGERCCWHCFNCTQYQIRHPIDENQCIPCRQGTVPDDMHSTCRDIPEEFLRPESGWAIGAMSFSATGILITLCVCGVFLKHNDTPVVRASGRELSYVLLSGILLCYLVTFTLVLRPTDIVCGIQRFAAGFCFTVVYAALLTKTNRISRIFNASKHSAKRPSFISPRSQLIICSGLVFVQILVNGVWMIIDPAKAMHHYPTREDNLLVCNSYIDASYMIAFAYPIMLIVVCTVYAVLTRKIPEAFNESKHIGFTMYTTCVIWLAFVPLYFGTGNNVALRITSMSVTISLSASVTIACLFSPKLYIILIRPDRNVRQSMMPARYSTTKSSAVTATNASSMIAPVTLTAATCDQNKAVKKHIATTIDCSTQSEYYELKDQKNGKPSPPVVSRSTQTTTNNDKDSNAVISSKESKESTTTTKQLNNNARIGNGPVNQSEVSL